MDYYKISERSTVHSACVDEVSIELGKGSVKLTKDQVKRLEDVDVILEAGSASDKAELEDNDNPDSSEV